MGRSARVLGVVALVAASFTALVAAPAQATGADPATWSSTPACTGWVSTTVPSDITEALVTIIGAGGGGANSSGNGGVGGGGATVTTKVGVTAGQVIWTRLGCGGGGGNNATTAHTAGGAGYTAGGVGGEGGGWSNKGGGGGGSSALCIGGDGSCGGGATVVAIAAGGGGGGAARGCVTSATGGAGGVGAAGTALSGSGFSGKAGSAGGNGNAAVTGGGGGSTGTGGAGVSSTGTGATAGSGGNGGNGGLSSGSTQNSGGGGGGAGWFGGGGGGTDYCTVGSSAAGAGGAGASWVNTTYGSATTLSSISGTVAACGAQNAQCTSVSGGNGGSRGNTGAAGGITLGWIRNSASTLFTTTPTGGPNGVAWATQPVIHSQTAAGTASSGDPIKLTYAGTSVTGTALSGDLPCSTNPGATDASGNATFAGCYLTAPGSYTVTATNQAPGATNLITTTTVTITQSSGAWADASATSSSTCGTNGSYTLPASATAATVTLTAAGGGGGGGGWDSGSVGGVGGTGGRSTLTAFALPRTGPGEPLTNPALNWRLGCGGSAGTSNGSGTIASSSGGAGWGAGGSSGAVTGSSSRNTAGGGGGGGSAACLGDAAAACSAGVPLLVAGGGGGGGGANRGTPGGTSMKGGNGNGGSAAASESWYGSSTTGKGTGGAGGGAPASSGSATTALAGAGGGGGGGVGTAGATGFSGGTSSNNGGSGGAVNTGGGGGGGQTTGGTGTAAVGSGGAGGAGGNNSQTGKSSDSTGGGGGGGYAGGGGGGSGWADSGGNAGAGGGGGGSGWANTALGGTGVTNLSTGASGGSGGASNNNGAAGSGGTITITTSGEVVTIAPPDDQITGATSPVNLAVTAVASSPSGAVTCCAWSATGLPSGLSIDSSTGVISGTNAPPGSYVVTVYARTTSNPTLSGSAQYWDEVSFGWTVVAPPTIAGNRTPAANAAGWNNEPVTVSFTCGSDALASCTSPVTVNTDGAGQSVSGTATDTYAQSTSTTVTDINIDRVAPTLAGVASSPPNADGWYHAPVAMAWTCDDALSGVAPGVCPPPTETVGEGTSVSVNQSVFDRAGNQGTAPSESVKVDMTAPSTGVSSPPSWSNDDVTLTLSPTDALSGVATTYYRIDDGTIDEGVQPVVSGAGSHTVEYWSVDVAGNVETASSVGVNIDLTAPTISSQVSPAPNGNGWHNVDVAVTFTCQDAGSGLASCIGDATFTSNVDTVVTGTATDLAGNQATAQATVRIDKTAPTVNPQIPPANTYGWFNAPVQASFTCSDSGGSGIASCPSPVMFSGEGAGQPVTGTGVDNADNSAEAAPATVSLDLTPPTITGAAVSGANGNGGYYGNVTVHWTCSDALSGIVACPADQVLSGEGVRTASASVNDKAGNTSSAEVTIRIDHDATNDPGMVHGVITDAATGLPVKGALVGLTTATPSLTTTYSARTGTDGSYMIPIVADGAYKMYVNNYGVHLQAWYPNKTRDVDAPVLTFAHGMNVTADQALTPGYVLQGTLTSGTSGNPVSGATVRVQGGGADYSAVSDSAGHYAVTGMVPGNRTVSIYGYGVDPYSVAASIPSVGTLSRALTPSAMSPGTKGKVTALTVGGAPLAGATVRVWMKSGNVIVAKATTAADGSFSLPSMPAGSYEMDVVRGDYRVRWFGDAATRTGAATVVLTASCTSTPDPSWGDPCAKPVDIRMLAP